MGCNLDCPYTWIPILTGFGHDWSYSNTCTGHLNQEGSLLRRGKCCTLSLLHTSPPCFHLLSRLLVWTAVKPCVRCLYCVSVLHFNLCPPVFVHICRSTEERKSLDKHTKFCKVSESTKEMPAEETLPGFRRWKSEMPPNARGSTQRLVNVTIDK